MIRTGAVITADIVNSSGIPAEHFAGFAENLKSILTAGGAKFFSFYRGDSFQCYLVDTFPAYRLALKLRAAAISQAEYKTDLKIAIGIADIETPVLRINEAMEKAFVISGRALDNLQKDGRRLAIVSGNTDVNLALEAICRFTDYLFAAITPKQAEVLGLLLENRTQVDIANILGKSQPAISYHVQSMGWNEMEKLIELYDRSIKQINHTDE